MTASPPTPTPPSGGEKPWVPLWIGVGMILLVAAVVLGLSRLGPSKGAHREETGTTAATGPEEGGNPVAKGPGHLARPTAPAEPAVILAIHDPGKVKAVVRGNAWLQGAMSEPLGKGFAGSWAAFLGTRGEDIKASFKGTVLDWMEDELLDGPFEVVWFAGRAARSTPALVIPEGSSAAFGTLDSVARSGEILADGCPAPPAKDGESTEKQDEAKPDADKIEIARWVLAGESLYASSEKGRVVLGKNPTAVLFGVCAKLPEMKRTPGADLEVVLAPTGLGREAELFADLAGVKGPRLAFAAKGTSLSALGIGAESASPEALEVAPLSEEMLKTIPADMPVVVGLELKLPATLSDESLAARFKDGPAAGGKTRAIALAWRPHGDDQKPELALVWGETADRKYLEKAFDAEGETFQGAYSLGQAVICKQAVFASTPGLLGEMKDACSGKKPSLVHASPEVVSRLKSPATVEVLVASGTLFSGLLQDAWVKDGPGGTPPAEMISARKRLEELPVLMFSGVLKDGTLVPGGGSS